MSYYKVCPDCGCNLDPGERCDCKRQEERLERVPDPRLFMPRYESSLQRARYGCAVTVPQLRQQAEGARV